jgi:hypothetical protein
MTWDGLRPKQVLSDFVGTKVRKVNTGQPTAIILEDMPKRLFREKGQVERRKPGLAPGHFSLFPLGLLDPRPGVSQSHRPVED